MNKLRLTNKKRVIQSICIVLLLVFSISGLSSIHIQAEEVANLEQTGSPISSEDSEKNSNSSGESSSDPTQPSIPKLPDTPTETGQAYLLIGENAIIEGNVGEKVNLKLPLVNLGRANAVRVTASPILSDQGEQFPFEIEQSEYIRTLSDDLKPVTELSQIASATKNIDFGNFKIREDLSSGYYPVYFKISYTSATSSSYEQIERYFFIKVKNPNQSGDPIPEPDQDPNNIFDGDSFDDGSYSPGFGDFGDGDNINSTPRILINGFSTEPDKLYGGKDFTLNLRIKNTSKTTAVKNIALTLSSMGEGGAVFMPIDGASTIYINSIEKDTEHTVSIKLKSNPTIEEKVYPLDLKFEYEDSKANPFSSSEMISLMVYQELRCDFGKIEIMPNPIQLGSEANVMFPIFNKGKATLYNLSILIPEDSVLEKNEIFIGNLEAGTSKEVDFMVKAIELNNEDDIPFQVVFEDAEGRITKIDHTMALFVEEVMEDDFMNGGWIDDDMYLPEDENIKAGLAWWAYPLIALAIIIVSIVTIVAVKKRKKKKEQEEIDNMV